MGGALTATGLLALLGGTTVIAFGGGGTTTVMGLVLLIPGLAISTLAGLRDGAGAPGSSVRHDR